MAETQDHQPPERPAARAEHPPGTSARRAAPEPAPAPRPAISDWASI